MKPKSKSKLKDKWLKYILCCVTFELSTLGTSALHSHVGGKRHDDLVKS